MEFNGLSKAEIKEISSQLYVSLRGMENLRTHSDESLADRAVLAALELSEALENALAPMTAE